jgi:NAD(P)-dependent dehydrogenase (short-subunit alcohol dehydrogenase family)
MAEQGSVVVVGGSSGLGLDVARHYADQGRDVVVTSRDEAKAEAAAKEIGGQTRGIALDLAAIDQIAGRLDGVDNVQHLALVAIERDQSTLKDYDPQQAARLVTLKLVGYTEVVHTLLPRMTSDASIVLFGGSAKDRPYPGSTTVTTANGGISSMVKTMAVEAAPVRVNAIHPSPVADNWFWKDKQQAIDGLRARTPGERLVMQDHVVDAVAFLFENPGVNGTNLDVNGGFLLT